MTDLWSPSFLENPTRYRQESGQLSIASHVASAKSCDTMSLVHEPDELTQDHVGYRRYR
jgi:hypothetical protein